MLWIVFTKDNSLLSRAIRWVTRGQYSHALIMWEDKRLGGWLRMEAGWDGYHIRPMAFKHMDARKLELLTQSDMVAMPLTDDYDGVLRICAQWLGRRYDYEGAAGFLWVALGRLIRRKLKNPLASSRALFCSEAIAAALKELGHPAFTDAEPATVSPQDLMNRLRRDRKAAWVLHD